MLHSLLLLNIESEFLIIIFRLGQDSEFDPWQVKNLLTFYRLIIQHIIPLFLPRLLHLLLARSLSVCLSVCLSACIHACLPPLYFSFSVFNTVSTSLLLFEFFIRASNLKRFSQCTCFPSFLLNTVHQVVLTFALLPFCLSAHMCRFYF